jgi:hypothetical protein
MSDSRTFLFLQYLTDIITRVIRDFANTTSKCLNCPLDAKLHLDVEFGARVQYNSRSLADGAKTGSRGVLGIAAWIGIYSSYGTFYATGETWRS